MTSVPNATATKRGVGWAISHLENMLETYRQSEKEATDLPQAFRDVADVIPSTKAALDEFKLAANPSDVKDIKVAMTICEKAASLCFLFDNVLPPGEESRVARYHTAADKKGSVAVEVLTKEMLDNILLIAGEGVVKSETIQVLKTNLQKVSAIPRSFEGKNGKNGSHNEFTNYDGIQSNNLGPGNQHINTSPSAAMYSGNFGTFHSHPQ
ncbi:hypothetical protein GGR54DRAFT_623442 [Hypoxylon sp. NC1633]|nr:hypothetical protein GGR54DRAFT_623442 [Hypoxylon sp. NC1633]